MPIQLFISKSIDEVESLSVFCAYRGWQLIAQSFLFFEPQAFVWNGEEDIIFFSSPRAVDFFHAQHPLTNEKAYACAGEKTKDRLLDYGIRASFVAGCSGKVSDMSKAFAEFAKGKRVLFPISNISKRSYSQNLPKENCQFIQVYQTHIRPTKIENCDLYIFTSPSNVKGFLMKNPVPQQPCISWGETTSKTLKEHGFKIIRQLDISSLEALIKVLSDIKHLNIKR